MVLDINRVKKNKLETANLIEEDDIEQVEPLEGEEEQVEEDSSQEKKLEEKSSSDFVTGKYSSEVIFKKIKNNPHFNTQEIVIGYMDRFKGLVEIEFEEFRKVDGISHGGVFIPFHRVVYFKWMKKQNKDGDKSSEFIWHKNGKKK